MFAIKCPHCRVKLGNYAYAYSCPHCKKLLAHNAVIPAAYATASPKRPSWLSRIISGIRWALEYPLQK